MRHHVSLRTIFSTFFFTLPLSIISVKTTALAPARVVVQNPLFGYHQLRAVSTTDVRQPIDTSPVLFLGESDIDTRCVPTSYEVGGPRRVWLYAPTVQAELCELVLPAAFFDLGGYAASSDPVPAAVVFHSGTLSDTPPLLRSFS